MPYLDEIIDTHIVRFIYFFIFPFFISTGILFLFFLREFKNKILPIKSKSEISIQAIYPMQSNWIHSFFTADSYIKKYFIFLKNSFILTPEPLHKQYAFKYAFIIPFFYFILLSTPFFFYDADISISGIERYLTMAKFLSHFLLYQHRSIFLYPSFIPQFKLLQL